MAASHLARGLLATLALLMLAIGIDGQGRRGQGRGRRSGGQAARNAPRDGGGDFMPGLDSSGTGSGPKAAPRVAGKNKKKGKAAAAPGGNPGAAARKAAAAKQAPPKPADPTKEADEITAAADHRSQEEEAEAKLLREHFQVCDLDDNGWISLREGEVTLSLGRLEYQRADANQDGRLDQPEFTAQRELLLARLGAKPRPAREATEEAVEKEPVSEPAPAPVSEPMPPTEVPTSEALEPAQKGLKSELGSMAVKPSGLLRRYDEDHSRGLGVPEIQKLLGEASLDLSPELLFEKMDRDTSGQLEANELLALSWLASQHLPEALKPAPPPPEPPAPLAPSETEPAASAPREPAPPQARGATHFERLDSDRNGFIEEADLRALQSPARLDLRLKALLSAMDPDGDGRLSETEFHATMNDSPADLR